MPGVQQIEHAVGEHDEPLLRLAPGDGVVAGADLGAVPRSCALARPPRNSLSAAGATKVVAITMRSTAPNTASVSSPGAGRIGEDEPDLAARHHARPRRRAGGSGATERPIRRRASRRWPARSARRRRAARLRRAGGIEEAKLADAPTLTKKIGVNTEATGFTSSSIVSNWLVPDSIRPAAKAPMMSAEPIRAAKEDRASANASESTTTTPRTCIRETRTRDVASADCRPAPRPGNRPPPGRCGRCRTR